MLFATTVRRQCYHMGFTHVVQNTSQLFSLVTGVNSTLSKSNTINLIV